MSALANALTSVGAGLRHWLRGAPSPPERCRVVEMPERAAAAPAASGDQPGDVLSPTGVSQYLSCSFRWAAKHLLKVPDPKTGALLLGSAVDKALTENFREKIETHRDLPAAGVRAIYLEAWDRMKAETEFHPSEDPDMLRLEGEGLTMLLLDKWAPKIQPAAVQFKVSGLIAGVAVRGYVDLLDVDGRVIDLKTAKKTPTEVSSDYRFQVATYARLLNGRINGSGLVATAVRNKSVKLVEHSFTIGDADLASLDKLYPAVQRSIRAGLYLPNRSHFMCSRRYCSAWRVCEREFGGKVGE